MTETLSQDAQAILLLCAHFGGREGGEAPLGPAEYGRLAGWLKDRGLRPRDFFSTPLESVLEGWSDSKVTAARVSALLARGGVMALALDRWLRVGIWVVTRSDPGYPQRYKRVLGTNAPPVLFGCGDPVLAAGGGLAVVGSRDAGESDLAFASLLGRSAAAEGAATISGGARGVDMAAMQGALDAGGPVVGVLANDLLKTASSRQMREAIQAKQLVLISPFHPEARFSAGTAMGRNKYIYALADRAVVVHSGLKGGTRSGAEENLRRKWVPLFVRDIKAPDTGNAALIDQGGVAIPEGWAPEGGRISQALDELRDGPRLEPSTAPPEQAPETDQPDLVPAEAEPVQAAAELAPVPEPTEGGQEVRALQAGSLYEIFCERLLSLMAEQPAGLTEAEIGEHFGLEKAQVRAWVQQALAETRIRKHGRPVRYTPPAKPADQPDMFN